MNATILVVDDDPVDIKALQLLLEHFGYTVETARSGPEALERLAASSPDLVVADVRMPGMTGLEVVSESARLRPGIPVVLITGHADVRAAVQAMQRGAFDYIIKPPDPGEFRIILERAIEHSRLRRENAFLRAELSAGGMRGERLIGRGPAMQSVFDMIERVARTDSTVLITGETGTGKELVAQTIHFRSPRHARPLVALNCAAVNPNLIESELFGHEKGAFTGAVTARKGRFEDADGGSLLLDEIADTTPELQARLLRVLQERTVERLGGNRSIPVDVRILAATNRDLRQAVTDGAFREDLFYRLSVIALHIPPLRERREDIPLLAMHFLDRYAERYDSPAHEISPAALDRLAARDWPGNIRELQHAIERAVVLSDHPVLVPDDFAETASAGASPTEAQPATLQDAVDAATQAHILRVLDAAGWHKQRAANQLGIDRATLYRLIRKFSLDARGGRP